MKLKLKGRRFDTIEEIQAKSQRVLDTPTEKDFQETFEKWRRRWYRCLHAGRTYFEVMAADRPYGEFYDFYSVSSEYFGSTLVDGSYINELWSLGWVQIDPGRVQCRIYECWY
jgi:hypothetical protein